MSAYIIARDHMNTIVAGLLAIPGRYEKPLAEQVGLPSEPTALGQALYDLNTAAVNVRYRENNTETYRYKKAVAPHNTVLYDRLATLIYQCSEGDVMESTNGQALYRAANLLAHILVRQLRHNEG